MKDFQEVSENAGACPSSSFLLLRMETCWLEFIQVAIWDHEEICYRWQEWQNREAQVPGDHHAAILALDCLSLDLLFWVSLLNVADSNPNWKTWFQGAWWFSPLCLALSPLLFSLTRYAPGTWSSGLSDILYLLHVGPCIFPPHATSLHQLSQLRPVSLRLYELSGRDSLPEKCKYHPTPPPKNKTCYI